MGMDLLCVTCDLWFQKCPNQMVHDFQASVYIKFSACGSCNLLVTGGCKLGLHY